MAKLEKQLDNLRERLKTPANKGPRPKGKAGPRNNPQQVRAEIKTLTMPACAVINLYNYTGADLGAPPDVLTLRKNKLDTPFTSSTANTGIVANDTIHSVAFADGDTSDVRLVPSTDKLTFTKGAFVMFFSQ